MPHIQAKIRIKSGAVLLNYQISQYYIFKVFKRQTHQYYVNTHEKPSPSQIQWHMLQSQRLGRLRPEDRLSLGIGDQLNINSTTDDHHHHCHHQQKRAGGRKNKLTRLLRRQSLLKFFSCLWLETRHQIHCVRLVRLTDNDSKVDH